jgi:hypothetical protein
VVGSQSLFPESAPGLPGRSSRFVFVGDSADKKEKGNNNIPDKHIYLLIKDPL